MATQVVRMERVEGAGGALGKHIDGDGKRPKTAAPRVLVGADGVEEKLKPVVLLDDEGEEIDLAAAKTRTTEAQKYMQKCRRKKTRGRQPMGGSTWVFAGPPRYDSEDAWSSAEVRSWAADCTRWVKKRSGKGSRIAHCALHQDEAAPHLHVTVIVADEQGRLGWNRIRKNFGVEGKTSGLLLMSGLQDNFHAAVGSKHGLDRGEVGSNREHAPVDRARGLEIRVEEEKNRTQQVTHQVKVEAGQAIAGVMERADVDAAERYRERLDKAREDAAAAKSETVTARRNAKAALEAAATAGERAGTAESRVGKLETSLAVLTVSATKVVGERDGLKQVLAGVPEKIADAVKQRDREWQPTLRGAEQRVTTAEDATGIAEGVMEEMRRDRDAAQEDRDASQGKRDQALRDLTTRTTERNDATTERNEALKQVKTVRADLEDWVERFVKVVRDLNPGRAELDRAAGRAGIGGQWLAQEVERGRGGIDR